MVRTIITLKKKTITSDYQLYKQKGKTTFHFKSLNMHTKKPNPLPPKKNQQNKASKQAKIKQINKNKT
jgi:hypothetical protein